MAVAMRSSSVVNAWKEVFIRLGWHMLVRWCKGLDCVRRKLLFEHEELAVGNMLEVDSFTGNQGAPLCLCPCLPHRRAGRSLGFLLLICRMYEILSSLGPSFLASIGIVYSAGFLNILT